MDYEEEEEVVEEIVEKKEPRIRGASPENGAQNLIRNAFVSARMELLDNYQGVDAKSVSAESIRLYPASNPEEQVDVYITINNGLKNILLEPLKVLKPNTEYIFEINSKLVDLEGIPFKPYKSRFKTGTVKLPKHISKNKPKIRVIPARKRIKLNPLPEGYLLKKKKPADAKPKPVAEPLVAENEVDKEEKKAEPSKPMTKKEKRDAAVAAKLAAYNAAREAKDTEKKEAKPVPVAVAEAPAKESSNKVAEAKAEEQLTEKVEEQQTTKAETKEAPIAQAPKPEPKEEKVEAVPKKEEAAPVKEHKPLVANIEYPAKVVRRDMPLAVSFTMPEQIEIRYMIKNSKGDIVKKGVGKVDAGTSKKTIPTKNLPPGKYKIAIKAGGLIENHIFMIKK